MPIDWMNRLESEIDGSLLTFLTRDRIKLHGLLVNNKHSKSCVIYLHGMSGNFYGSLPLALSEYFNSGGFALFSINTRGHNDAVSLSRIKDGKRKRIQGGTSYELFEDSWKDIDGAIDTLQQMGFTKFVLCGHSTGCQKITYYQYKRKDRRVSGLILLAPADDYNLVKRDLGSKFVLVQKLCTSLIGKGKGSDIVSTQMGNLSAKRLDSIINLDRIEARLFNYDGALAEFSKVTVPIFATFGSKEEYAPKDVGKCLKMLDDRTNSKDFKSVLIKDADHSFRNKTDVLGKQIDGWLKSLS